MSEPGKVLFRNVQTGQLGYVDAAKAQTFVDDPDYRPASTEELAQEKRDADNRTFAGKAETALLGAAESISDTAQTAIRLGNTSFMRVANPLGGMAIDAAQSQAKRVGMDLLDPGRSLMGQALGATIAPKVEQQYAARARELKEANAGAWTVGEVGGGITTGLLTGGVSGGFGKMAATGLAKAGLKQGVARLAGTGLAMAAEGGFYGAAGAETAARLSGKTTGASAEELLQGIGLGALLGGGMAVGGGATMAAFRKLVAKADEVLPGAGGVGAELRAAQASDDAAGAFREGVGAPATPESGLPKLWEASTGASRETLEKYGPHVNTPEAIEGRRLWQNRDKVIESAVPKMTAAMDQMEDALNSITSNVKQFELKEAGVHRMLEGIDQLQAKRVGISTARAVEGNLTDLIAQIPGGAETKSIRERLTKTLSYTKNHIDEFDHRASAARVFVGSDFIKKELQRTIDSLQFTSVKAASGTTWEAARAAVKKLEEEIQEPFRKSLEQESVWGRAGVAQREINGKWKPFIETGDRFKDELMRADSQKVWADGRRVHYADSAKIASWLDGVGTTRGQTAQERVREHIAATTDLLEAVNKYHPLDSEQLEKLAQARKAYETVNTELGHVDKTVGIANEIEDVARAEQKSSQLTSPLGGRVIGTVSGAIAGGPMGAVIGGLGMLNKPASAMAAADQIRSLADRIGVRMVGKAGSWVKSGATVSGKPTIGSRLSGAVQKAKSVAVQAAQATAEGVERSARVARKVAVPASVALFQGRDKDLDTAYERRSEQLLRVQQDPDKLLEKIAAATGGLHSVDPDLAGTLAVKAQASLAYLSSQLPSGTLDPTALEPGRKALVSRPQMMQFARIWQAVERPMSVIEDLERGLATPEQIEAVRTCHPETYQAIRSTVQAAILEVAQRGGRIPLGMRRQLDLLLDLDGAGEPAFAPDLADRIAALQAKQDASKPQSRPRKPPNFAKSAQLPQQNWPSA